MSRSEPVRDEEIIDAIEAALEDGEAIPYGGVPTDAIADRTPLQISSVRKRCKRLTEEGELDRVVGVPRNGRPRPSYRLTRSNKD